MSEIRDEKLAPSGEQKIEWAKAHMPLLRRLEKEFSLNKPFANIKVSLSIHLEAKTAYLCRVLAAGGAIMAVTGSNPLSTQDDVAAALSKGGIEVFAWHGATAKEYERHISMALSFGPNAVIDDGADLSEALHTRDKDKAANVLGACEETTTGLLRFRARELAGSLKYTVIAVNDAYCKHLFDNRYGTGQSVLDGIMRTTNLVIAGKCVVVAGYGWCGKGIAMRAKGLGARVIVTEVNHLRAMEAAMDGYGVMPMAQACAKGDIFITATGCNNVITLEHYTKMKDGAILCNAGHFNVELDLPALKALSEDNYQVRKNITAYKVGKKTIYVLAEGRLVNLAAGDGHPIEIMDLSFAIQSLSLEYLIKNKLPAKVIRVPGHIDERVAQMALAAKGIEIDKLSGKQLTYMYGEKL